MKKVFSTGSFSKNEEKKAISPKATQEFINCLERIIKDKHARKEAVSVIKALDGKRIKNTSGV